MEVKDVAGKGRGVFARQRIEANEYLFDYEGQLVSAKEAELRHACYSENASLGSYILWFRFDSRKWAVDATFSDGTLGRLVNHSSYPAEINVKLRAVRKDNGQLTVEMRASRDIEAGTELLYDYNDSDPDATAHFAFLKRWVG